MIQKWKPTYQNLWNAAKVVLRGKFYNNKGLCLEKTTISNDDPNFTPQNQKKEE